MASHSPWGEIIEIESIGDGIDYVTTSKHGGLRLDLVKFNLLNPYTKSLGIKLNNYFFFEKNIDLHCLNLELSLNLFPVKNSINIILNAYPDYIDLIKDIESLQDVQAEIQFKKTEEANQDPGYIQSVVELDYGFKITTISNQEFLVSDYFVGASLSDLNILGELTNFFEKNQKKISIDFFPQELIDKFELTTEIIAQVGGNKNSYVLELYRIEDLSYIGAVDLYNFPSLIQGWNNA